MNAFFSLGNRSAAIRVPKYADQPDTARFEFRPPDATCNVYLALAAQLMAGHRRHAPPHRPDRARLRPDRRRTSSPGREEAAPHIKPLPTVRSTRPLDALERDHEFLLAGDVFDEGLIADWIARKLNDEYYEVRNRPHPYEMALYFDV